MSTNLIAYIPTLNQRHINWFKRHQGSDLFLISQDEAKLFLPRLDRNMAGIPTEMAVHMIEALRLVRRVWSFDPDEYEPDLGSSAWKHWVLPDEDVSRCLAEKYLLPSGCKVEYEMIWARWDMKAVLAEQPVVPDAEISTSNLDREFIAKALRASERSPDWWRRVGALVTNASGEPLAVACNTHFPNEYETYIFGDPVINRDAGQVGKSCALHAEDAAITDCARYGKAVDGGRIYVTTFPCEPCARKIAHSGIRSVYFRDGYSSLDAREIFRSWGIRVIQVKDDPVPA